MAQRNALFHVEKSGCHNEDSQVGIPPWLMVFLLLKYVPGLL